MVKACSELSIKLLCEPKVAFESQLAVLQKHQNNTIRSTQFCHDKEPSLARACLEPQLHDALRWGVDIRDCPRILEIQQAFDAHPAFQAAHPDKVR